MDSQKNMTKCCRLRIKLARKTAVFKSLLADRAQNGSAFLFPLPFFLQFWRERNPYRMFSENRAFIWAMLYTNHVSSVFWLNQKVWMQKLADANVRNLVERIFRQNYAFISYLTLFKFFPLLFARYYTISTFHLIPEVDPGEWGTPNQSCKMWENCIFHKTFGSSSQKMLNNLNNFQIFPLTWCPGPAPRLS